MVIHQNVRVKSAARVGQRFAQQREITPSIVIVKKAGQTIIAALNHMLRNTGQIESRLSGHCLIVGASMGPTVSFLITMTCRYRFSVSIAK
jgi:hypothetical protein